MLASLHINPGDEVPIFRQLIRQVAQGIAAGRIHPGDKMPSHRELAEHLVIAPLTVKKAYDELERQGLLRTQRGRGTFVHAKPEPTDMEEVRRRLQELARRLWTEARLGGVTDDEVRQVVEAERPAASNNLPASQEEE